MYIMEGRTMYTKFYTKSANTGNVHNNCVFCGDNNPLSSGLWFQPLYDGSVLAEFQGRSFMQGYNGII
jgi:hypothetical protein